MLVRPVHGYGSIGTDVGVPGPPSPRTPAVEIIAVDRGPGIADMAAALEGRIPEPGGLGCGLGAVRRASARFDISSDPAGTVVLSVVDLVADPAIRHPERGGPAPRSWAGVSIGISEPCGDGWAVAETADTLSVAVVDGLGHGPKASIAADAALSEFASDPTDLDAFPRRANERMRDTRGAAVTLCRVDHRAGEVRYLGIGNVSGRVIGPAETRGLVSYSGTLGLQLEPPRAKIVTVAWPPGASLVLWTDGLSSRVGLAGGDALLGHDPAVVAATLHRDHARGRDDATVVVVRSRAGA